MVISDYGRVFLRPRRAGECGTKFVGKRGYAGEFDWTPCTRNFSLSIVNDRGSLLFHIPQTCDTYVNKIECNSDGLELL